MNMYHSPSHQTYNRALTFSNDIDNYLNTIDENIWLEKLKKIANKKKSIMKSKSYYMFVSKMKNDLYAVKSKQKHTFFGS